MKKVLFYLCFFLLFTLTAFGQKKSDAAIKQAIEAYEVKIGKAVSALDYDNALDNCLKIIGLYEKKNLNKLKLAAYYTQAGQLAYELGAYRKALKYQLKALTIQQKKMTPVDLIEPYQNITKTCIAAKLYPKAVKYQKQVILILEDEHNAESTNLAIAYGNVGRIYEAAGEYELALQYFQEAAPILKGNEQYKDEFDYYQESIVFLERELGEPALPSFTANPSREVVYGDGKTVSELSMALSILHLEKNYAEALIRFNKLNEESETGKNWESIGLCHYHMGSYPEAIAAYQKALALSPQIMEAHYHNNIGVAYAKNGQLDEAKTAFEAYEAIYPKDYWHCRNWGMWYALQGEKTEAIRQLKLAVALGFSDVEWLENDSSLDSIRDHEDYEDLVKAAERNFKGMHSKE